MSQLGKTRKSSLRAQIVCFALIADSTRTSRQVRFVPKAEVTDKEVKDPIHQRSVKNVAVVPILELHNPEVEQRFD
jgi:hypothetical protein